MTLSFAVLPFASCLSLRLPVVHQGVILDCGFPCGPHSVRPAAPTCLAFSFQLGRRHPALVSFVTPVFFLLIFHFWFQRLQTPSVCPTDPGEQSPSTWHCGTHLCGS